MTDIFSMLLEYTHTWIFGLLRTRRSWPVLIPGGILLLVCAAVNESGMLPAGRPWLAATGILAVCAAVLYGMYRFPFGEGGKLEKIWKAYGESDRKTYEALSALNEKLLFPWELEKYRKRKFYLLMRMGDIRKAEETLKKCVREDSADYQMFLSFKSEAAADMDKSVEYMQKAREVVGEKDSFLKGQILNNYGRLMVIEGNYQEADFYFKKARDLVREKKHKELLHPIYQNLLINWCRLKKPREEIEKGLREYYFRMDMDQMENILEYNNLQISLARQLDDREWLNKSIADGFEEMLKLDLTKQQRLVYLGSMARMVCTARTSPERCLEEIAKDVDGIFSLPVPERYEILKQIGYMFAHLYYPRYAGIAGRTFAYLQEQALKDLETYADTLPEVCVNERCHVMLEICGVLKQDPDTCDFEKIIRKMEWVRDTYARNGLYLQAIQVDINIADECIAPYNLDRNFIPVHRDVMRTHVEQAEEAIRKMKRHPQMAEIWLNLSYQSYHLMRYQQCREHFQNFRKCDVALPHFTPEFQMMHHACELLDRILDFYDRWQKLEQDAHRQQALSKGVRAWFAKPLEERETDLCMLLARYMGYEKVTLKQRIWFEGTGSSVQPRAHVWFRANEGGLEADLTYRQFPLEAEPERLFFTEGRHPMETGESVTIRHGMESGLIVNNTMSRDYSFDSKFEKSVLGEIYGEVSGNP